MKMIHWKKEEKEEEEEEEKKKNGKKKNFEIKEMIAKNVKHSKKWYNKGK